METYKYKTTSTDAKDKSGQRTALRCTKEERQEMTDKLQAQGYIRRTAKISDGRWAYWWDKPNAGER